VVDFGTATTFDVVDDDGAYVGGVIAPGVNLSLEALHMAAAALPHVDVTKPQRVIGTNTVACMQSGIFWGYVGLVREVCDAHQGRAGRPMRSSEPAASPPCSARETCYLTGSRTT
jgi:type III pantothenate kinase